VQYSEWPLQVVAVARVDIDTDGVGVDLDTDEDGDARGSSVPVPGTDSTGWRNRIVLSSARVSPWSFGAIVAKYAF
jgi:hypothetical protein